MPDAAPADSSASSTAAAAPSSPPFKPQILRHVTRSLLKMKPDDTVYVKADGKLRKADPIKNSDKDEDKEPPVLLPVINLVTGEVCDIICGSVLVDTLNDAYPKDAYVGKGFMITVRREKGKRYNTYSVAEIAIPK